MRVKHTTPKTIRIRSRNIDVTAELNDTKTANEIWKVLPVTEYASVWGSEVYFDVPMEMDPENLKETVELGDLGYWTPGSAFCIFFGPTPMSKGDEIRPASPVNLIGKINGDPKVFEAVKAGDEITIEQA